MRKTIRKCDCCGKETTNPRFCSRTCAGTENGKKYPKRKITKKCKKCNSVIRNYRSTLCEVHFQEHKGRFITDATVGEYQEKPSVKGKHPSWINSHIRAFARSWLKHMTNLSCACCGYDKHVELAHIKPVSSFELDTLISVVNSEENVI